MDSSEHEPVGRLDDAVPLGDEARRTEQALQQLQPRPVNLDRERLMFLAGIEAGSSQLDTKEVQSKWLWPAAALAMSTVAACLAVALTIQLSRPPVERVIVREVTAPVPVPTPAPPYVAPSSPNANSAPRLASAPVLALPNVSALQMRNMALRFGVESLPADSGWLSTSETPSPGRRELRSVMGDLDSSL
jgi:hypothetical protein